MRLRLHVTDTRLPEGADALRGAGSPPKRIRRPTRPTPSAPSPPPAAIFSSATRSASTTTTPRSSGRPGTCTGTSAGRLPPGTVAARAPTASSLVMSRFLCSTARPLAWQNGRVNSSSAGKAATARARARSYAARWWRGRAQVFGAGLRDGHAGQLQFGHGVAQEGGFLADGLDKAHLQVGEGDGERQAGESRAAPISTARVGRPAARRGAATATANELRKCRETTWSGSVTAVRFTRVFQSSSRASSRSKRARSAAESSMPNVRAPAASRRMRARTRARHRARSRQATWSPAGGSAAGRGGTRMPRTAQRG